MMVWMARQVVPIRNSQLQWRLPMKKTLLSLAAGLALLATSGAYAQGYIGGAFGWTEIDADCSGTTKCDTSDTGYKVYGGYRFANQFAVELVYFDWGKATASIGPEAVPARSRDVPMVTGSFSADLTAKGVGLGVAYFLPFSPEWSGVARLGVTQTDAKLSASYSGDSGSVSNKDPYAYYGLGVAYHFNKNLALTADADFSRAKFGAEGTYDTANVRLLSLGLSFMF
jgi:OmpA-OmpF porin, OOP family